MTQLTKKPRLTVFTIKGRDPWDLQNDTRILKSYSWESKDNEIFTTYVLNTSKDLPKVFQSFTNNYLLTEDQINNHDLYYDWHNTEVINLNELRKNKDLIEIDCSYTQEKSYTEVNNNFKIIYQVTYRTNDIPLKEKYERDEKLKLSENFRTKLFVTKKYNSSDIPDHIAVPFCDELKDLLQNIKQFKDSKKIDSDCSLIFNDQGIISNTKYGNYLLKDYCKLSNNLRYELQIDNIDKLIKVYQLLVKQYDYCNISINTDLNLFITLSAGNSQYNFYFWLSDQKTYELVKETEKDLTIYQSVSYPNRPLVIDLDLATEKEMALVVAKNIARINKHYGKKLLGKKTIINASYYLTDRGFYFEIADKKSSKVYQSTDIDPEKLPDQNSIELFNTAIKFNDVHKFFNVMYPLWEQKENITYEIILDEHLGWCLVARTKNAIIANMTISPVYSDDCIITRWIDGGAISSDK